jgi:uncharacterized protein YegJ (DUF2314 family)
MPIALAALIAISAALAVADPIPAPDRAAPYAVDLIEPSDPIMAAAVRKARAGLPQFLALKASPGTLMKDFSLKVAVHEGNITEYFWIFPFERHDDRFAGLIDSAPQLLKRVKLGEAIVFSEGDIVDWLYFDGSKMIGNYTTCATLARAPPAEAEALRQQGLECE